MLRLLLDGDLYPHGLKVRHHAGYPNTDGPVCLIVPGRYYAQHTDQINEAIQRFVSVLMVVTSDEEATFDCSNVLHERIRFWVQTPRGGREYPEGARFVGVGFSPHFNDLPAEPPVKMWDVFLAGQRTHLRRDEAFEALEHGHARCVVETGGFTQGLSQVEYTQAMTAARVAPAPSGAVSPDSFRLFEALEAHCVPIADTVSPVDGQTDYWHRLFPLCPFPIIEDYASLPGYIDTALEQWPANSNRVATWWILQKRRYAHWLREDLQALGAL
jgi:hypothetical protein